MMPRFVETCIGLAAENYIFSDRNQLHRIIFIMLFLNYLVFCYLGLAE